VHAPDAGRLGVFGREERFGSPRDALRAGVGMVHQELAFCPNLSVAENLTLGSLPSRSGFVRRDVMRDRARAMLADIGATLELDRPVGALSVAQQQLVQIAVAVGGGARLIVFDEPTSSLSQREAERLYALIARLKGRGVTCIYVSHRLPEVFLLCDAVSVLRDGRHVATQSTGSMSEDELVRLMIGRPLAQYLPHASRPTAQESEALRVAHLSSPGRLHDISFTVRRGEVVALAGLVGAGRSEVARALFGLDARATGRVWVSGREVALASPVDAIRHGLGFVPEDRKAQGIVPSESALHNASLAILERLSRLRWVQRARERGVVGEYFGRLRVRATALDAPVARLSGGNQQKVVLARWLAAQSQVLILDEPTRGVDVGAKAELHALVLELAANGLAVLLISSELPEVLALATRILVLRAGRIVAEVPAASASQDALLRLMAGLDGGDSPTTSTPAAQVTRESSS
jgi:ABC-type sugar transport system ATPase subunit